MKGEVHARLAIVPAIVTEDVDANFATRVGRYVIHYPWQPTPVAVAIPTILTHLSAPQPAQHLAGAPVSSGDVQVHIIKIAPVLVDPHEGEVDSAVDFIGHIALSDDPPTLRPLHEVCAAGWAVLTDLR